MAIAIIVLCVAVVFWMGQFYDLMRRRDDEFPGHFDKPIWAGVMLFGSVFGAFV